MERRRVSALLLAGMMMALQLLGGCGTDTENTEDTEETEEATELAQEQANKDPLVVATASVSGTFSGFYSETDADCAVVDMTSVYLLTQTRSGAYVMNGIEGETENYNGTDYTYYGIADCVVTDQEDGSVTYDFTLREDVTFSDGTPLTADDVIFSLYVYLDPSYDGPNELSELPIQGLEEYTQYSVPLYELLLEMGENNTNFDYFSEKTQTKFYETDWPEAKSQFIDAIMDYYDTDSIADVMVAMDIAEIRDTGYLVTYHSYVKWSLEDGDEPTAGDLWKELMAISAYSEEVELMSEDLVDRGIVPQSIFDYLPEKYHNTVDTSEEAASSISGIEKTGDYSLRITLSESDTAALIDLAIAIQPLHYYGDTEQYDYESNSFGFSKGNLQDVKENCQKDPLGAGPYVYVSYTDGTVYFEANESYWKGTPAISYLHLVEMSESEMASAVANGEVDIAEPSSISSSDLEQIRSINSNGTESGDVITTTFTDYEAFGYIGINAATVSVGGDSLSDASIALRTALAVVLTYYRFESVYSYYGDTAELIEYPISDSSWVSPREWENTFSSAYRYKENGSLIYTTHSTLSERRKAVLSAALQYLKSAGYTVKNGKVTKAPEGAKLEYTVMITGGGVGDHPSYSVIESAAEALESIGITLTIEDYTSSNDMFAVCQEGTAELWCAAWPAEEDPDVYLYALFHSDGLSNYMFSLTTDSLNANIEAARASSSQETRKELYQECLEEIAEYAVMIPVYQRQNCTLYSSTRMDTSSITADQTSNYTWRDEIELLQKKA